MAQPSDFRPFDLGEVLQNVYRLKAMQAAIQDDQEQRGRQASLRDLFARSEAPTAQQVAAIDPALGMQYAQNQAQMQNRGMELGLKQLQMLKSTSTDIVAKADSMAPRGTPQWNQAVQQIGQAYIPLMAKVTGHTPPPGQPVDPQHVLFLADMTPAEIVKQQQASKLELAKQQQAMNQQNELFKYNLGAGDRAQEREDRLAAQSQKMDAMKQAQSIAQQGLDLRKQQMAQTLSGNKPLPAESAGKLAMLTQASKDIEEAKKMAFDDKGELNRSLVAESQVPFTGGIGGRARMLRSRVENAVAAKLRLETGAAANNQEVQNIADRFMPSILDTTASARDKFDRLNQFLVESANFIRPGSVQGMPQQQDNAPTVPSGQQSQAPAITPEKIMATAKKYGQTPEQVIATLRARGLMQ